MSQIIYILKNESMPEYVKIGFTHGDVKERIRQLDRTGVPLPFEVYYAANVENAEKEEKWLHSIFADRRARDSREFFKMNPEYATLALKRIEIEEIKVDSGLTPEQEKEVDEVKERRSRFHFAQYGIPVGSKLTFTRDSNIIAEVVEGDKIKINDKINSLSTFAMELLGYKRRPQGTLYFEFEDEILDDRRRRIDNEEYIT
ncbi:MAG: GIY-YIG nuclease family protein [Candidatus Pacebacteria bacterium]|nr:GIY-YIG nuclease family protein [Candidatus Paceibacterota bacterium]